MTIHITYGLIHQGYHVTVHKDGQPIDEYRAGNHPLDSQGHLEKGGIRRPTLARYAKQTALETAKTWGLDEGAVSREDQLAD